MYGQDIYYVPRTLVNRDTVFGETDGNLKVRGDQGSVNNVEGWEGQGEFLASLEFARR